jgi:molybdate transport system substrate-binding protein
MLRTAPPSRRFVLAASAFVAASAAMHRARAAAGTVTVYAAMTLRDALGEVAAACEHSGGPAARLVFGASGTLAKQLEEGAAADVFFPADTDWMDYAQGKGLIREGSRLDLLTSRLVLVGPKTGGPDAVDPANQAQVLAALGRGRLAMCDPQAMPAGRYGKASLQATGLWPAVADRVAIADTVRAALLMVERGEAPLGVVFDTDAAADPAVRTVGVFPDASHPPIVYPVALTRQAGAAGQAFLGCLHGADAATVFRRRGYAVLGGE